MVIEEKIENNVSTDLTDIVEVFYIDDSNAVFTEHNGFISLSVKKIDEETKEEIKTEYERVFLHRVFPFEMPTKYISVLDKDSVEIGMIDDIEKLSESTREIIEAELSRKYFMLKIKTIHSLKERYGFSYWKVTTDEGELDLTLQDTYKSIFKLGGGRLIINDVDGNRYEIENVDDLDRKSYKKIELYL